ncbi:MAG: hypothetical protein ABIY50_03640 [Ignavibacteria bacterium]
MKDKKPKENISSAGIKESGVEFSVEYDKPRRIFKIDKQDLNGDSVKEIIVMSVAKDTTEKYNDYYNFDMLEVFSLSQEKKKFVKILSETVDYATTCMYEDLESNRNKQILIATYTGGNDAIVSNGMFVYNMTSADKIDLVKYFDSGDPKIENAGKDNSKVIFVSDEFWGVMPMVNVISFVKEIYRLENNKLVIKNSEYADYYENIIKDLKVKYHDVKREIESGAKLKDLPYPLYREAAEVIVNYYSKDDMDGLKSFWDEEKNTLQKNTSHEEFTDLNNFINKVLPSSKNA